MTRLTEQYIGIRLEGGLLANSLLERVAAGIRADPPVLYPGLPCPPEISCHARERESDR